MQPPVEAQPDHPPQPLPVPGEQLGQGPLVPPFQADEQVVIVALVLVAHGCLYFMITARRLRLSTGSRNFRYSIRMSALSASAPLETDLGKSLAGLWTIGPGDQLPE